MSPNVEFVLRKHCISLRAGGQITQTETMQTQGEQADSTQKSKLCWIDFYTQKTETKKERCPNKIKNH